MLLASVGLVYKGVVLRLFKFAGRRQTVLLLFVFGVCVCVRACVRVCWCVCVCVCVWGGGYVVVGVVLLGFLFVCFFVFSDQSGIRKGEHREQRVQ